MASPCDPDQQAVTFRGWADRPDFYISHSGYPFRVFMLRVAFHGGLNKNALLG